MNEIMFYGGIAGAVIFGAVAIFLFFYFHIKTVIGDLTGYNAKRSIQKLQQEGYVAGVDKETAIKEQTEQIHARRGRTTAKLHAPKSERLKVTRKLPKSGNETTLLSAAGNEATTVLMNNMTGNEVTTVLMGNTPENEATAVLVNGTHGQAETTVLTGNNTELMFEIVQNVQIINTTERI